MGYAIRIDGNGWRAVASPEEVDTSIEYYSETPPVVDPITTVKDYKKSALRYKCEDIITRTSFSSEALGQIHNYDSRAIDQLNLKMRYEIALDTGNPEPIWASDGTSYQWKNHSAAELLSVLKDMNDHIKTCQLRLASRLAAVDAASTIEQVEAVIW